MEQKYHILVVDDEPEIADLVGEDNIYLFGALSDKVIDLYARNAYHPEDFYGASRWIREAVDFITGPELSAIGSMDKLQALQGDLKGKDYVYGPAGRGGLYRRQRPGRPGLRRPPRLGQKDAG